MNLRTAPSVLAERAGLTPAQDGVAPGDLVLSLDAFVRSIGVRRMTPHALFLGAGASVSSGIPSAQACIWEWKRNLFLTNNPSLEGQFAELSLPSVQRRIQQWLEAQGTFPVASHLIGASVVSPIRGHAAGEMFLRVT